MGVGTALAVVGGISAVGGIYSGRKSRKMQKRQMSDWNRIYGGVQKNLTEYFENLTPDLMITQGLEDTQREFQKAQTAMEENLAQRGLGQSGEVVETSTDFALARARAGAKVRRDAPAEVARQKMAFLEIGAGQKQQIMQGQAQAQQQETAGYFGAAGTALGALAGGIGEGNITSVFGQEVGKTQTAADGQATLK